MPTDAAELRFTGTADLDAVISHCGLSPEPTAAQRGVPGLRLPDPDLTTARVMIVDDEPVNIKVARKYLSLAGYSEFVETSQARSALQIIQDEEPDILLLDLMMPEVNGLEILCDLRDLGSEIPVLILTAVDDRETKARALEAQATDFLTKPIDSTELVARVGNAVRMKRHQDALRNQAIELERLVDQRTAELARSRLEVIHCLGRAAEFRDNDTGKHVVRVGRYSAIIAREMGLDERTVELIEHAAPLHDVGKIGIPDSILLKPGRLEPAEFDIIKRHCAYGDQIVGDIDQEDWEQFSAHTSVGARIMNVGRSPILQMATRIAMSHHEKWDGSGYPRGLSGTDIPIEGRITAVADVFDALSSKRPYKDAFPLEKCLQIIGEGRGTHFDPDAVDAFFAQRDAIVSTMNRFSDDTCSDRLNSDSSHTRDQSASGPPTTGSSQVD